MGIAARVGDPHVCPVSVLPAPPHVGGPIIPPGVPTVLIGNKPAATVGDQCVCTGPMDAIMKGSGTVFINKKPAARAGDTTAHGGTIMSGCATVIIGD
jgi:uncharacterized Zn-binding protein involved in type VI secretion